jgi:lambda family phage portal protein
MTDNIFDRVVGYVSPRAAVKRAHYRRVLAYYEAANPDRTRKGRVAPGSGNLAVNKAGRTLREMARYFEQNHDLARGVLNDLVLKTVGPTGIACEPQPRTAEGEIHDGFAAALLDLWRDWCKRPEVTWLHDWASTQRLLARSWFRDGDVFAQQITGTLSSLNHGTTVPFSLEMIEADLVPIEYSLPPNIVQGIELNAWGRPTGYYVYMFPPGEQVTATIGAALQPSMLKRVSADRMLHCRMVDRIRQLRGVSLFATVLQRLDDLKDYEESERIAAKVAASMAAVIKKGLPDDYAQPSEGEARELKFRPGMIFDDLRPGEDISTIDTKRPNANLLTYRQGQLRGVASGTGTSFSSIARDYGGTYSAQRQELVESWAAYATLAGEFTAAIVRPVYESFVAMAIASGAVRVPADVIPDTIDDAIYIAPQMPWIDPESEAVAATVLERNRYESGPAIIRRRGQSPRDIIAQESAWQRALEKAGLQVDTGAQQLSSQNATRKATESASSTPPPAAQARDNALSSAMMGLQIAASGREIARAIAKAPAPVVNVTVPERAVTVNVPDRPLTLAEGNLRVDLPAVERLAQSVHDGTAAARKASDRNFAALQKGLDNVAATVAAPIAPVYGADGTLLGAQRVLKLEG